ncbi:hypothetical protein D3C75_1306790 [compost metagenome]
MVLRHLKSNKTKSWVVSQQVVLKALNYLQVAAIVRKSVKVSILNLPFSKATTV